MVLGFGGGTRAVSWQEARDRKRQERQLKINQTLKKLGPRSNTPLRDDLPFLSASVSEIVRRITVTKEWTATRVLEAYIRSALRAQEATNCLTEIRFTEALDEAKKLDADFASSKRPKGALHGLPISIKDCLQIRGLDASIGASSHCGEPAEEDALVVAILKDAGAIPFVKTAVPQTMLSFECSSPIWGVTTNPYSESAVPGGSSGGEAALIAADGSPVGIGSDVGGSARIPAHFSGCFGLKTCWGRLPTLGHRSENPGFEGIRMAPGPLGRTVEDLELITKVLIQGSKPYWHSEPLVPLPWRDQPLPSKLKFGYYKHDNFVETSPACVRAVEETVDALRKAGHEMIELPTPDTVLASTIFTALTSADGHENLFRHLESDPRESFLFLLRTMDGLGPLRGPLHALVGRTVDAKMAQMGAATGKKTTAEVLSWQAKRNAFVKQVREDLWLKRGLDGVIAPVQAIPALGPGESWRLLALASHTYYWNVCDASVGVVPVTFVDAEKDDRPADTPFGDYSALAMGAVYGTALQRGVYDSRKMQGLPVGVQVIGPAWSEERVLSMMRVVDHALGERGFGPGQFAKRKG